MRLFRRWMKDACWRKVSIHPLDRSVHCFPLPPHPLYVYVDMLRLLSPPPPRTPPTKSPTIPGRDPDRWRYDAVGNVVCRALSACDGPLCHEYDHIHPFAKGESGRRAAGSLFFCFLKVVCLW